MNEVEIMIKKLAELRVTKSADYYDSIVESLQKAGFVIVMDYETTTERFYIITQVLDKEPQYELGRSDEEIKLGLDLGDEVVNEFGAKGVVVGIDTGGNEVLLSLLMSNYEVPQIVKASRYKTKTGRHFPQIREVLKQIKGE